MANQNIGFHFPPEIHLERKPLAEAWLELQWRTGHKQSTIAALGLPEENVDAYYQLALGTFYQKVRQAYPFQEALPTSQFPDNVLPYVVRHRFRTGENKWPVLQIGPGIATVNLIDPYSWELFREQSLFLRESLLVAYDGFEFRPMAITLRYRNAFPFDYLSGNMLVFLAEKLNLHINTSPHIPGEIGENSMPTELGLNLGYVLRRPSATGNIRIATATQTDSAGESQSILLADLEVRGRNIETSLLLDDTLFPVWLDEAHAVIHEWFFALIDGHLQQQYGGGL